MADEPLDQDAIEALIAQQAAAAAGDGDAETPEEAVLEQADEAAIEDEVVAEVVTGDGGALSQAEIEALLAGALDDEAGEPVPEPAAPAPLPAAPAPRIEDVQLPELPRVHAPLTELAGIDLLMEVPLQITVELGQATRTIRELLEIGQGSLLHLSRHAGEPVDVLVNGQPIAKGEVVVIDENFGIRVTEVVSPADRLRTMAA